MKKNSLKRIAAAAVSCAMMAAALPAVPFASFAEDEESGYVNLISNSTFDKGTQDWGIYKESGGAATLSTVDGQLAMKITNQGRKNYAVQLFYDIVPLYKNGVYRLRYDISSSIPRYVEAMIQMNGGDYRCYTWKGIQVKEEPTHFDYTFTMTGETDIMTKFCFNCGIQEDEDGGAVGVHTIYLDNVILELIDDSEVDYDSVLGYIPDIVTNQVGFKPNDPKKVTFRNTNGGIFSVVDAETKKVVYKGSMGEPIENKSAAETNYVGDFSCVTTPGTYYISANGLDDSYPFVIGDDVYSNLLDESVRMLYLQRCGMEIEDTDFGHPACHTTDAVIYKTSDKIDVSGGWHDAGDYGRYIVAAAKAVADLLYAYDASPEKFSDNIGIPESGNGVPDVLDEVRYELEWMMKMQDAEDGGVYHKVTCAGFPAYIMPQAEIDELIVMPKSTTASADFAASMAMAYEFYKEFDSEFADKCLEAGRKAYEWAEANPKVYYSNPADVVTGEYGDKNATDERYWAAAQLYRATGEKEYGDAAAAFDAKSKQNMDWSTVGGYGDIALLTMDGIDKTSELYQGARDAFLEDAQTALEFSQAHPYGEGLKNFYWGSNMGIANAGIMMALAAELTGDPAYMDGAKAQLSHLLGQNANAACYVSGYGTSRMEAPHHRPSMCVGKAMPCMLSGGVNPNLEDSAAKAYCKTNPPAKCWVDNAESYSTNEVTIYWNSPLTYLLAVTDGAEKPAMEIPDEDKNVLFGDANLDGEVGIADAAAILQHIGNPDVYGLSPEGERNADVYNRGDGVTGMDALAVQKLDAKILSALPESYKSADVQEPTAPVTTATAPKATTAAAPKATTAKPKATTAAPKATTAAAPKATTAAPKATTAKPKATTAAAPKATTAAKPAVTTAKAK